MKVNNTVTWFCSSGHNVFVSDTYTSENPPECAQCGSDMTQDSDDFVEVIEASERYAIREAEQVSKAKNIIEE